MILRMSKRFSSEILAVVIAITTGASLYFFALSRNGLLCDLDCGETLVAVKVAADFARHGVEYGFLENGGTREEPLIYTHNVNLGILTFDFMEWIGVHDFDKKILLPIAAYSMGLIYAFLVIRRLSGSELCALVALLLFATAYWPLGAFAANALRAWHLWAFFGAIYHATALSENRGHLLGLAVASLIAFCCGYDFWIICLGATVCVLAFNLPFGARAFWMAITATIRSEERRVGKECRL